MWSPSSCYRRLILCRQTSALHLHSLTGNTGLRLPFLPFHSFSTPLWCFFFSSQRPSVPDVFSNAKVWYGIQEGASTNKKAFSGSAESLHLYRISNLLFHANASPVFHVWTFPPSDSSRPTCRCPPSHLLAGAVKKWLTTNRTCRVSEKWVLDSSVATTGS